MQHPLSAAAVHKQYDEAMTAYGKYLPTPALRAAFGGQADGFMRQCALGLWQRDGGLTPLHVEYHNAIYTRGRPVPVTLYWELCTAVAQYPGFQPPEFFQTLLDYDLKNGEQVSRRFVDTFTLMLLLFAGADGVVSENEAGFVNRCADELTRLCDAAGVPGGKAPLDAQDFITRRPDGDAVKTGLEDPAPAAAGQASQEPEKTLEELLAELDGLCGLEKVKADVKSLMNLVKVRRLREQEGLPVAEMSLHLVFMGNPGTGKTTVARLLAGLYRAIGVLSRGQLVEVDRSGLVAGFVGQTALKTSEVIEKALGGVLFIDEAYSLANAGAPNDFGQEAVETLLKAMEDHRDDLVVIVAGYPELMDRFIHANPGLESRFNKYFYFEDYSGEELMEIFLSLCEKNGYALENAVKEDAAKMFRQMYEQRDENFGNAREVRNLFERAVARQSDRVAALEHPGREALMALTAEDLELSREEDSPPQGRDGAEE
ncbi:MAG: AAA family ATPase [Oscillospiraceae bacterium]|nr:AAA family ATPase [Oscillospiraceae bacterium]